MGFWNVGGSRAVRSRLVGLKTSPLSESNDSWSGLHRGAALSFCSSQAGFCARQHLFKVCFVTKNGKALSPFEPEIRDLVFLGVPATSSHCSRASNFRRRSVINLERALIFKDEARGVLLCVQDFVRSPHFTQRNFSDSGIVMLAESAAICGGITNSAVFEPWSDVETASRSQVVAVVCVCVNQAVDRRRAVMDSKEQW